MIEPYLRTFYHWRGFVSRRDDYIVRSTTEDNIPEFDRKKVSLDIPSQAFGTGFTLLTNVSKVLSNLIKNSALRTQSVAEALKPIFRGKFTIEGLPSDNTK